MERVEAAEVGFGENERCTRLGERPFRLGDLVVEVAAASSSNHAVSAALMLRCRCASRSRIR